MMKMLPNNYVIVVHINGAVDNVDLDTCDIFKRYMTQQWALAAVSGEFAHKLTRLRRSQIEAPVCVVVLWPLLLHLCDGKLPTEAQTGALATVAASAAASASISAHIDFVATHCVRAASFSLEQVPQ